MLNLNVAYVNQAEREREIEDGLRRRQILQAQDKATTSSTATTPTKTTTTTSASTATPTGAPGRSMSTQRRAPVPAQAAGR